MEHLGELWRTSGTMAFEGTLVQVMRRSSPSSLIPAPLITRRLFFFFKVCRFWLSGRRSCVKERCKHNEAWLFLLLCKQALGVSKDLIDHRIRALGPLMLWWRTLGTRAIVKSGGDLLKIWVRIGVYWSAQAFRQEGERPSGPGAFLGPVGTTFLGENAKL